DVQEGALDADRRPRQRGWRRRGRAAFTRWCADEELAEETGGVGVGVDAGHQLVGHRVDAGAAAYHLVKADRGFQVFEKDDVADAGDVDAGGQQLDGGGDEMAARRALEIGKLLVAADRGGAAEGVEILDLLAVFGAPRG